MARKRFRAYRVLMCTAQPTENIFAIVLIEKAFFSLLQFYDAAKAAKNLYSSRSSISITNMIAKMDIDALNIEEQMRLNRQKIKN